MAWACYQNSEAEGWRKTKDEEITPNTDLAGVLPTDAIICGEGILTAGPLLRDTELQFDHLMEYPGPSLRLWTLARLAADKTTTGPGGRRSDPTTLLPTAAQHHATQSAKKAAALNSPLAPPAYRKRNRQTTPKGVTVTEDIQQTLVLIKPDGVQRGLVGEIITRLEARGLRIAAMKMTQLDVETASHHYGVHRERPFFKGLVDFITSSPLVALVLEGPNAVELVRRTMGATNPLECPTRHHQRRPGCRHRTQPHTRLRFYRNGGYRNSAILRRRRGYELPKKHPTLDYRILTTLGA